MTVTQTDEGDEFVVSWYPPEYGLEFLQVYVVSEILEFEIQNNFFGILTFRFLSDFVLDFLAQSRWNQEKSSLFF